MPKAARWVVAGLPHHMIQRGLRSMNVFEDDADREAYPGFLAGAAEAYGLQMGPGPGREVPSQIASRTAGPSAEAASRCLQSSVTAFGFCPDPGQTHR